MPSENMLNGLVVAVRQNENAAGSHNWLGEESCDAIRPRRRNQGVELVGIVLSRPLWEPIAIRGGDVPHHGKRQVEQPMHVRKAVRLPAATVTRW